MLLERTEYVVIATLQPAITLEWVSASSDTFGTSAVFRWRTRDISTGHIVIQILRGSTVVYTFPNRTPSTDWVEETWVRIRRAGTSQSMLIGLMTRPLMRRLRVVLLQTRR